MRASSMSIASGCDYGILSRISELKSPSILERCLLCPQRAYYVTVKVKNPIGLPGANSLQGDIICFTQDGPAEAIRLLGKSAKETLKERIDWVRGGGNFRVVCLLRVSVKTLAEKTSECILAVLPDLWFQEIPF